jgi:plastocyanin
MLSSSLAAATFHDSDKTAFFVAAGVLVGWAVIVSFVGIRRPRFLTSRAQARGVMAISAVFVIAAASMAVATAKTPPGVKPYLTGVNTDGEAPPPTPIAKTTTTPPPPSPPVTSKGSLALAANPVGELSYDATALSAKAGKVTIDFTNKSPLGHNVTIASAAGKVLGATPTFMGGSKTLTLNLPPGTYTFYCSVPGHEMAGMKGTLTVK